MCSGKTVKTNPLPVSSLVKAYKYFYEDDTADIGITNVHHNRILFKRPLDCPIIGENRVNVVTIEVRSSIVCLTR